MNTKHFLHKKHTRGPYGVFFPAHQLASTLLHSPWRCYAQCMVLYIYNRQVLVLSNPSRRWRPIQPSSFRFYSHIFIHHRERRHRHAENKGNRRRKREKKHTRQPTRQKIANGCVMQVCVMRSHKYSPFWHPLVD